MTKESKRVIDWRVRTKERIIQSFGGSCGICEYKKCQRSLDLHHLDPSQKEFSLSSIRAWPKAWDRIVTELRKCVLLCKNCHGEVHDNVAQIPPNIRMFDEKFSDYRMLKKLDAESKTTKLCPVCNTEMFASSKTCSKRCAASLSWSVDWTKVDLHDLIILQKMSQSKVARMLGCSHAAVWKRAKKLNIKSAAIPL